MEEQKERNWLERSDKGDAELNVGDIPAKDWGDLQDTSKNSSITAY